MPTIVIDAQLEIDSDRGVIYVHGKGGQKFGVTVLRMCGLPRPVPTDSMLDITVKSDNTVMFSWAANKCSKCGKPTSFRTCDDCLKTTRRKRSLPIGNMGS